MALEINKIYNLDCREGLKKLDDDSIDCCITSPPYWSLRDYGVEPSVWDGDPECEHEWSNERKKSIQLQAGNPEFKRNWREQASNKDNSQGCFCQKCDAWLGCLGLETTFELYIKHLCDIFDVVKQKLKKLGTCFVNLGDTYAGGGNFNDKKEVKGINNLNIKIKTKIQSKSLLMIPQRFAMEMVNRGWILRNVIIWHKPNCMPSSAKDRFTVDFEYVYFFVKNKKYYFEQQFEPLESKFIYSRNSKKGGIQEKNNPRANWKDGLTREEYNSKYKGTDYIQGLVSSLKTERDQSRLDAKQLFPNDPKKQQEYINHIHDHGHIGLRGRNKRCVWSIPTKPNSLAHFATFNSELITPMIKGGCPKYICKKCGKPRQRIFKKGEILQTGGSKNGERANNKNCFVNNNQTDRKMTSHVIISNGYTDCGCNADLEGGIVLDPFAGIGTTLKTAWNLGRSYIGFELNPKYCELGKEYIQKECDDFKRNKHRIITKKENFNKWL